MNQNQVLRVGNRVRVVSCNQTLSTAGVGFEGVVKTVMPSSIYGRRVEFVCGHITHGEFELVESGEQPEKAATYPCNWCGHENREPDFLSQVCASCTIAWEEYEALKPYWRERIEAGTHDCVDERLSLLRWARANRVLKKLDSCGECGSTKNVTKIPFGGSMICYQCAARRNGWNTNRVTVPPDPPSGTPTWPSHSAGPSWED